MHIFVRHRLAIAAVVIVTLCPVFQARSDAQIKADAFADNSKSLFDGKTMNGWEGNKKWFRVQDGAIVAGTLKERIPHNEFLCTKQRYQDFELRLEAKLIGEGKNAGVQFRSERIPDDTELIGYQADIGTMKGRSIWGALYDESRRRKFLVDNADASTKATKNNDWNKIRVVCEGGHIQIFINETQTVDYKEADGDIPQDGIIGLQIHSGAPAECWYRNIRIRKL